MNNNRRKDIVKAKAELEEIRGPLAIAIASLTDIRDEEQEAFDNMPESMQDSERGEKAQAAISALETALETLEEIEDTTLEEISDTLDEASE